MKKIETFKRKAQQWKTLRYEPLEERQLLAVDSGLMVVNQLAAMENDAVSSANVASYDASQNHSQDYSHGEETALVPGCLFKGARYQ